MKAAISLAFVFSLFAGAAMAPAEQHAEYEARKQARINEMNVRHLPFLRRLVNHSPDPDIAQMTVPAQHSKD